jgi:hypothetical protein
VLTAYLAVYMGIVARLAPIAYHRLVLEGGWASARFERWFTDILIHTLIAADYQPEGTARVTG